MLCQVLEVLRQQATRTISQGAHGLGEIHWGVKAQEQPSTGVLDRGLHFRPNPQLPEASVLVSFTQRSRRNTCSSTLTAWKGLLMLRGSRQITSLPLFTHAHPGRSHSARKCQQSGNRSVRSQGRWHPQKVDGVTFLLLLSSVCPPASWLWTSMSLGESVYKRGDKYSHGFQTGKSNRSSRRIENPEKIAFREMGKAASRSCSWSPSPSAMCMDLTLTGCH